MYTLTDRRFEKAKDILEKYNTQLYKNLRYDYSAFEFELRECWDTGYREIKDILIDLIKKHPKFRYLALYYMQFQNSNGPVSEFHETLAEHYGAKTYYSDDCRKKKDEFWEQFNEMAKAKLEISEVG